MWWMSQPWPSGAMMGSDDARTEWVSDPQEMIMAETPAEPAPFIGFSPDALQFLADLAANNDRNWFKPRKADYERLIKEPLESLCVALADRFDRLRLPLQADPKRSPFRIYRDVRFSKDKSPYKSAQGADFPWRDSRGDELRASGDVGGYFHLEPGNIFVGGGMWRPDRARLAAFRDKVDQDPSAVFRAIEDSRFVSVFDSISGEFSDAQPQGLPGRPSLRGAAAPQGCRLQSSSFRQRGLLTQTA